MRVEVGVCTWVFGHHNYPRIADRCIALGFVGVELLTDIHVYSPANLKAVFNERGLKVFSMTPENVDIAHADKHERERAVRYYEQLVDFAAELGSTAITCHEYVGRTRPHDSRAKEWERLVGSCARISLHAEARGVDVVFEPLNHFLVSSIHSIRDVLALVKVVVSGRFKIVLDSYHMHHEAPSPSVSIHKCRQRLGLYHVADSNRRGIGSGDIDFDAQFKALHEIGYRGAIILECTEHLMGPALLEREVGVEALEHQLRMSHAWRENFGCLAKGAR